MWWDSVSGPPEPTVFPEEWYPSASILLFVFSALGLLHCLNVFSRSEVPKVTANKNSEKNRIINMLDKMTVLHRPYVAPKLWGRSGHMQTAIYGALKHSSLERHYDQRISLPLPDGSTITFDIFEPICSHQSGRDVTLVLTPGISNCAESNYIRTLVHHSMGFGFRCAALNHIGVIQNVEVTGNRIFNYGTTEELTVMMDYLYDHYPKSLFINVGFSMGGNLTALYMLRTPKAIRSRIIMAISVCQGYSATISAPMYHDWTSGRRFYNLMIVENMKRILRRNYERVVIPHVISGKIDEMKLWSATSIASLDDEYNRRVVDFDNLDTFYEWCSCLPLLEGIDLPMLFLNSEDDPVVPAELFQPVVKMCQERDDLAFVSTKHGGHLGFLEGGSFSPSSVTWLDRFIVDAANQAISIYS